MEPVILALGFLIAIVFIYSIRLFLHAIARRKEIHATIRRLRDNRSHEAHR